MANQKYHNIKREPVPGTVVQEYKSAIMVLEREAKN